MRPGRTVWPQWRPATEFDPCIGLLEHEVAELAGREPPAVGENQYLTDHGVRHLVRVLEFAGQLVSLKYATNTVTDAEKALVYASALMHDIGLYAPPPGISAEEIRREHANLSALWIHANAERCGLSEDFSRVLATIVAAHRRRSSLETVPEHDRILTPASVNIRPRFLAALLRIADALDVGQTRAPIAVYRQHEAAMPPESVSHWEAYQVVTAADLAVADREVVLHIRHSAQLEDPYVLRVYLALQSEIDAVSATLRAYGCVSLHIVLRHQSQRIEPGALYGRMVAGREAM